jgi:hypothetical protein
MQTIQPVKRGGRRVGAGRSKGSGRYRGEPTVVMDVPVSAVPAIKEKLRKHARRLPLYVVGKPSEKLGQ